MQLSALSETEYIELDHQIGWRRRRHACVKSATARVLVLFYKAAARALHVVDVLLLKFEFITMKFASYMGNGFYYIIL